ncbi:MAG TPA: TonB family protein [Arenimonas sp.]|mgnify:FL=1|nr:TonB family protein [Arenimonas sp.]HOZ03940.1 TonB family protein [Arenimonas sp.]HPW33184.1 TonB family protein [Arenimonas sp.]
MSGIPDSSTATPPVAPKIGPNERLSATLALAAILHGIVILGVGFSLEDAAPVMPTLDVILTETQTTEAPKQADFIAQANNKGGGDKDEARRPRESQLASVPKPDPGIAPIQMTQQAPAPEPDSKQRVLSTTADSEQKVVKPEEHPITTPQKLPTGRELMQQSLEMARLAAEIERKQELYAKRPKKKFISASTQAYEYASYMRDWVRKVERVGNANYPEQARIKNLSGTLVMTVAIRRDGSVEDIVLTTPSNIVVLDQAAIKFVRLAQPFAPIPKTSENIDVLYITRTFKFYGNGDLETF